jgi:hypothetical protein
MSGVFPSKALQVHLRGRLGRSIPSRPSRRSPAALSRVCPAGNPWGVIGCPGGPTAVLCDREAGPATSRQDPGGWLERRAAFEIRLWGFCRVRGPRWCPRVAWMDPRSLAGYLWACKNYSHVLVGGRRISAAGAAQAGPCRGRRGCPVGDASRPSMQRRGSGRPGPGVSAGRCPATIWQQSALRKKEKSPPAFANGDSWFIGATAGPPVLLPEL